MVGFSYQPCQPACTQLTQPTTLFSSLFLFPSSVRDTDWTTLWRDTEAVFQFGFDAAEFTFAPSPMTSTFDLGSDGLDGGHGGGGPSFMM